MYVYVSIHAPGPGSSLSIVPPWVCVRPFLPCGVAVDGRKAFKGCAFCKDFLT